MSAAPSPSAAIDAQSWARAGDELVERLRDLIRIPSVNPPPPDAPDGELRVATRIAEELSDAGLVPEVVEPFPGRGSVSARLRGDGSGGEPLLLLGHLDVVPAPPELWTHDPFGADLADGYVWGRGAVDMKNLVAMEIGVVRLIAAAARDAGRDPAADPVPGLTRDVILTVTADEEAGGHEGAGWIVENRPEWLRAAGAINESGAVATTVGGQRFYPIGVAERGYAWFRITVRGTWGHASVPRDDNAAVLAGRIVVALGVQGSPDPSPVMTGFFAGMARKLGQADEVSRVIRALGGADPRLAEAGLDAICEPATARVVRALLRTTVSPTIVNAGVKANVIPGEATIVVDVRHLPGQSADDIQAMLVERMGPELAATCTFEVILFAPSVDAPAEGPLWEAMVGAVLAHDPDGVPLPFMVPFATDAKHTVRLDVPTYGFSPLMLDPAERFLERFHGVDERVSVDALRWGLPVLYDAVEMFCGHAGGPA